MFASGEQGTRVRGEQECVLFIRQFVEGKASGPRQSEQYEDIGTTLPRLPACDVARRAGPASPLPQAGAQPRARSIANL